MVPCLVVMIDKEVYIVYTGGIIYEHQIKIASGHYYVDSRCSH